ncbi:MAG: hypothetical protein ACREQ5_02925 [Candidatus Dormibacteria bacterium]
MKFQKDTEEITLAIAAKMRKVYGGKKVQIFLAWTVDIPESQKVEMYLSTNIKEQSDRLKLVAECIARMAETDRFGPSN